MEGIIKSSYEISIWEDMPMIGTYDTVTKEIIDAENIITGDTYDTFSYTKERKVAIIGSDTMTSPARAMEPCLVRNVNGTVKLTFYIFNSYYDEDENKMVINPFKNLLINEAKIKIKYRDEWFDLIIKDIQQDLETRKSTFTASNLFISELSKNGYGITLDTELENNIGTITDLAETILTGSDWTVDDESDELAQTTEEALFKITLKVPMEACTAGSYYTDEQEIRTLPKDTIVYGFYSSIKDLKDGESTQLQILYHDDGIYNVSDDYVITESTALKYQHQYFIDNVNYEEETKIYKYNGEECFSDVSIAYSELYRADRLIKQSTMVYEPITEQVCYRYTFDIDENYWATIESLGDIPETCIGFNEQTFLTQYSTALKSYFPTKISITGALGDYVPDFDCFDYFNKDSDESINFETPTEGVYQFYGSKQNESVVWSYEGLNVDLADFGIYVNENYLDMENSEEFTITVTKTNDYNFLSFKLLLDVYVASNGESTCSWRVVDPYTTSEMAINGSSLGLSINSYSFAQNDDGTYNYDVVYTGDYEIVVDRRDKQNQEGYMKTDTDTIVSSSLCNYIGDGDSFTSNESWSNKDPESPEPVYTIYPALNDLDTTKTFRDFIYFQDGNSYYTKLTNAFTNYQTNGFTCGKKFILRFAGGEVSMITPYGNNNSYKVLDDYPTGWPQVPFTNVEICDYRIDDKKIIKYNSPYISFSPSTSISVIENDIGIEPREYAVTSDTYRKSGKRYFSKTDSGTYSIITDDIIPEGSYEAVTYNDYITYTGTCTQSLSRSDIYSGLRERDEYTWKIGLFFTCDDTSAVEAFQLFDYQLNDEGDICTIGDVPNSSNSVQYSYFYLSDGAITADDIVTVKELTEKWEDTEDGVAHNVKPSMGEHPFEKIRTVTASKSNRFNLIQELCETFSCWALFEVEHEDNGQISLQWDPTSYPPKYAPVKKIKFKEVIGDNLGYGFKYGVNLKSMSRTINSDSLVTKLIVNVNSNEYAPNGFCTIQRSEYNETKQNYLLNFNYYIQHEMIDNVQYYKDFYEDGAYFDQLSEAGKNLEQAVSDRATYVNNLTELESSKKTYSLTAESALKTKKDLLEQMRNLLIAFGVAADTYVEYQILDKAKLYIDELDTENYSETMEQYYVECQQMDLQYSVYSVKANSVNESMAAIKSKIAQLDEQISEFTNLSNELDKKIYQKYYRFVQEGTWQSEDYYDDDLYYIDAKDVLGSSCTPQVTYNISVIDLKDLEDYKAITFGLGDVSFVQDPEFFGYTRVNGIKTPYKEEVVISELTEYPESPEKNVIKIQNFKTQFEDLFQRITAATQSLQYASGGYNRATKAINLDGTIDSTTLSNSLNKNGNVTITNSADQSNAYGSDGFISTNLLNNNYQLKISNGAISATSDGGVAWKEIISSGSEGYLPIKGGVLTGDVTITGLKTKNNRGFKIDSAGGFTHLRNVESDYWSINNNAGESTIKIYPETGKIDFSGGLDIKSDLTLIANQNQDSLTSGALFVKGSNIQGINALYFNSVCDKVGEGINFMSNSTDKNIVDTLCAKEGELYFIPKRTLNIQTQYDNERKIVVNSGHQDIQNYSIDIACTDSDATKFVDGAYVTLPAGKWIVFGSVILNTASGSGTRTNCARIVTIENSKTVVKMEEKSMAATREQAKLTVSAIVDLYTPTKVVLQKATSAAETSSSDTANHRTIISAICIGPQDP